MSHTWNNSFFRDEWQGGTPEKKLNPQILRQQFNEKEQQEQQLYFSNEQIAAYYEGEDVPVMVMTRTHE
jgi:hypothetical protein